MLTTVIVTIVLFALLFAGMAIGVILSDKTIKGSCGGLGSRCDICEGDPDICREQKQGPSAAVGRRAGRATPSSRGLP
ncbi:MAG: hypothetical protein JJT90_12590 [Ectothiorhodospiraceae bacterium]|nr:hypothetical protein [Ectothiorhodospiraceae bacterium]